MADEIGLPGEPIADPTPTLSPITEPFRPTFPDTTPPVTEPAPEPTPEPAPEPAPAPLPLPKPVAPVGGLPELFSLAGLLTLLGLLLLAAALVEFVNWLLRPILNRLPGGRNRPDLTTIQFLQPLSNALGGAYAGLDEEIGLAFTTMGQLTSRVGQAILDGEQAAYVAATKLAALAGHTVGVQATGDTALRRAKQAQGAASSVAAQTTTEKKRAIEAEQALQTQTYRLQHNQTTLIEPELESLRHRIGELETGATTAFDVLKQHSELLGASAFTAATAMALGRLGADWATCEASQLLGRGACKAGPQKLKDLLDGLLDIAGILALCPLIGLMVDVAESGPIQDILGGLVAGLDDLVKCRGVKAYSPPAVEAANLSPTVFGYAALGALV